MSSGAKASEETVGIKKRLAHLERKVGESDKPQINITPLVQRLDSLEEVLIGYRKQLASIPKNGDATNSLRLDRLEEKLEELKVALVKLPPNGGLVVRLSSVERSCGELEKRSEEFGKILATIAGLTGEGGRVKKAEDRLDKIDERLEKLSSIHYKLLALGTAGAFVGGLAVSLLKYLF